MMWQRALATVAVIALAVGVSIASQGCGKSCNASNCASGCCDANGTCQPPSNQNCGLNGKTCVPCIGAATCAVAIGQCELPGSTAGITSGGSGSDGSASGSNGTTASNGGSGSSGTSSTTASTTAGTNGSSGSSSGSTGQSCSSGQSCSYDNDCGGSQSCFNGCCVNTANSCLHGSAAYGPCAPGWDADPATDCCALGGQTTGGGTSGSNGGSGGTTGGFSCVFDGGISGGVCNPDCPGGFHCVAGSCVLNGGNGPIQVTLRFDTFTDLDLHVIEPGGCEVFYGNRTCFGSLDLDANAGCSQTNVWAENVIYPPIDGGLAPPSGTYTVRVDDWSNCTNAAQIPYEVIVRHNGQTDTYCMGFGTPGSSTPAPADNGGAGSGTTITTFTYP
ncbi:MAG: hypothetical protein JST54_33220 [Deltaproteobacteria bacterium]|nr:hypothetical protein [Deltaproteobacteria bacterium]